MKGRYTPALFLFVLAFAASSRGASPTPQSTAPATIQWEPIKSWSGRGNQYLDSFPSEGALRIEWEATRSGNADAPGSLEVVMHSAISGRALAAPVVDHRGEGKGTAYFSEEPRVFFASVISSGVDWKIAISERVR